MTTNVGELWVMLLAPLLGIPLPLLPLQILLIDLRNAAGLPAIALSVEPAERHTMQHPPRPPSEHVLAGGNGPRVIVGWAARPTKYALGVGYWVLAGSSRTSKPVNTYNAHLRGGWRTSWQFAAS